MFLGASLCEEDYFFCSCVQLRKSEFQWNFHLQSWFWSLNHYPWVMHKFMEEVYQLNFISSLHIQQASIVDTLYLYRRLGFSSQLPLISCLSLVNMLMMTNGSPCSEWIRTWFEVFWRAPTLCMYVCMYAPPCPVGIGKLAFRTDTLFTPAPLGPVFLSIYLWEVG